jgi:hypothetical protein
MSRIEKVLAKLKNPRRVNRGVLNRPLDARKKAKADWEESVKAALNRVLKKRPPGGLS